MKLDDWINIHQALEYYFKSSKLADFEKNSKKDTLLKVEKEIEKITSQESYQKSLSKYDDER